jgi:hypothetical protein
LSQRPAILPWPSFFHRLARGIGAPAHSGGACRHATASLKPAYSARGKTARESTQRRMPSFSMMLL